MRKMIVGALVRAGGLTAVPFGTPLVKQEMRKCQEMMRGTTERRLKTPSKNQR